MKVTFWGVRGSIPVSTAQVVRWGGQTSCVQVHHAGLGDVVFDAGTGIRGLGQHMIGHAAKRVTLLLSHLHVDHVIGLPFFAPMYAPGWQVKVGVPAYTSVDARGRLEAYLNGTFHPVRLRELPADPDIVPVRAGRPMEAVGGDGWHILPFRLRHPGGSLGYRVTSPEGASVVYLTDTQPFAQPGEGVMYGAEPTRAEKGLLAFLQGADLVVYDTMYDRDEYLERMDWGHSYPEYAASLCEAAGVGRLALFHHSPDATDDQLDAREVRLRDWAEGEGLSVAILGAREGLTLHL